MLANYDLEGTKVYPKRFPSLAGGQDFHQDCAFRLLVLTKHSKQATCVLKMLAIAWFLSVNAKEFADAAIDDAKKTNVVGFLSVVVSLPK